MKKLRVEPGQIWCYQGTDADGEKETVPYVIISVESHPETNRTSCELFVFTTRKFHKWNSVTVLRGDVLIFP